MVMYETSKAAAQSVELQLEKPEELAFCASYAKLPISPDGTIRIFERNKGEYYSAHGQDALYIARHVYRTNSVLKYLGPKKGNDTGLASCTLSQAVAVSFMRDALTAKQLRIEIWSKEANKGNSAWRLDKSASPGNLQDLEGLLFSNTDILAAPIVAACSFNIKAGVTTVGIAFADSTIREIGVTEFVDNEMLSNVESFIIQLGIKEMLMPMDDDSKKDKEKAKVDHDAAKFRTLIDRCGVVITDRKRSEFRASNIQQDLSRLLRESEKATLDAQSENKQAMSSCAALISYLDLLADEANSGAFKLVTHDLGQFMRLDASAVRALHLMPDPNGMGGSGKNMSIFGVLNKCRTAQGTRMLAQWLKQPLVNLHEIERRQNLVECFTEDSYLRQSLQDDHLKTIPDLTRLTKKLARGLANLQDVARIYQAILRLQMILELLRNAGGETGNVQHQKLVDAEYVQPLSQIEDQLKPYVEMVETTLDLEELDNNNYVIKPEFSEDLKKIKTDMDEAREEMDAEVQRTADDLGFENDGKTLHFEKHTQHGHVMRLTRKEAKPLDKKGHKYITLITKSNGTLFTTKALKRAVNDHQDLQAKYDRKQSSLVKEVVAIAASYCEVLLPLNAQLAHLDVVVSLAHVAVHSPTAYVKPKLTPMGEGNLILKEARHPCLEVQDDINFIPNDIELKRGTSEFNIITGPNMGGKSTYIRQVGVIALLAQMGSFVPCDEASLPVFDSILARVGAGDYQLKGVSTFMAEMLETASIIKSATKDSLIIIDELGRGTSTYDGFGLAWSISEHIATEMRSFCLFATHFHELCALADQIPHVTNLHVLAQVEEREDSLTGRDITLLYKVEPGSCDQSFGIAVAELAHFPAEVVALAKRKAEDLEAAEGIAPEVASCSPEEVSAGASVLREFLIDWAKQPVDKDVDMSQAQEVARLKECFERHKPNFEANTWASALINPVA